MKTNSSRANNSTPSTTAFPTLSERRKRNLTVQLPKARSYAPSNENILYFVCVFLPMLVELLKLAHETSKDACASEKSCNALMRSFESCPTTVTKSTYFNQLQMINAFISLCSVAFPLMVLPLIATLREMFADDVSWTHLSATATGSFTAQKVIKNQVQRLIIDRQISQYFAIDSEMLQKLVQFCARPQAATACLKARSSGFPSGHSFTLTNLAMEAYRQWKATKNQTFFVIFALSIYATFTRHALEWHTPGQIILTIIPAAVTNLAIAQVSKYLDKVASPGMRNLSLQCIFALSNVGDSAALGLYGSLFCVNAALRGGMQLLDIARRRELADVAMPAAGRRAEEVEMTNNNISMTT